MAAAPGKGGAGQDAPGADGDAAGPGLMGRAELKAMLTLAKRKPVGCAIALTRDKQPLLLLHRTMRPRQVLAQLRKQAADGGLALDTTSLRFGRATVDGASDGQQLGIAVNKPVPNEDAYARKLRGLVKPVGCRRCSLSVDESLDADGDEAGDDGDTAGGVGGPVAGSPTGPGAGQGAPGAINGAPTSSAVPSPAMPPAAPAVAGADRSQAAGSATGGAAPRTLLAGVVPPDVARGVRAALDADPQRRPELAGLLAQVRAGMDGNDPDAAEVGIAALRQAVDGATPAQDGTAPGRSARAAQTGPAAAAVGGQAWAGHVRAGGGLPGRHARRGADQRGGERAAARGDALPRPGRQRTNLDNQHSVMLRVGEDGVLTDRTGRAVGRLGGGEVVPLPGVDIPGLFHGDAATPPVSQQPLADETPDGLRDGTGWVDRPPPARAGAGGVPAGPAAHAMTAAPPGLQGTPGSGGLEVPPPVPASPGLEPLPEEQRRALGQNAPFPANPDAGQGSVVSTPIPDGPLMPPHTGGTPPATHGADIMAMASPTPRNGVIGGRPTGRPTDETTGDSEERRGHGRENEALRLLAKLGYQVEQNPPRQEEDNNDPKAKPDARIGGSRGNLFDVYSPKTNDMDTIRDTMSAKVSRQADRLIINLKDTSRTRADVERILKRDPVKGLKELFTIDKQGKVFRLFPEPGPVE